MEGAKKLLADAGKLAEMTGLPFVTSANYFESLSTQDAAVEMSGQLRALAVSLMKISNDLRWKNSGPIAGIGEIALPALQPGSSIMPGKVNPVIPEAMTMVCAQVMGNDLTISIGGQAGNFQLNVMLPVIAYNLLQSITLLANGSRTLADLEWLVMPPLMSVPLMALAWIVIVALFGTPYAFPIAAGFYVGYVVYDEIHFHVHHRPPRTKVEMTLRRLHLLHHFRDPHRGYGVSAPYWDYVFGTAYTNSDKPGEKPL